MSNEKHATPENDLELIKRFVEEKDELAFKQLVVRYQQPLYQFIWRYVGHHDEAADLSQKCFVQLFLKADQFQGRSSLKTWLYQIAVNLCKSHFRANDRSRLEYGEVLDHEQKNDESDIPLEEHVVNAQEQQLLKQAISRLPEVQRLTLTLRLYQDVTYVEIGQILDCPVGTAKANYHLAVKSLRKLLNEYTS